MKRKTIPITYIDDGPTIVSFHLNYEELPKNSEFSDVRSLNNIDRKS